jgi:lipoprotein-anchoring transpeptidase ErfK/SrfK
VIGSFLGRRSAVVVLILCLALGLVVAAAAAYDHSRANQLALGIHIDRVDVGGLSASAAAARLRTHALQVRRRSLYVHTASRTFVIPAGSVRVTAEVDDAVARALADSRRGWFGSRAVSGLTGGHVDESIALRTRYAPGVIPRFVQKVAAGTDRPAVDAAVKPQPDGLKRVSGHSGITVDTGTLRRQLANAVLHPSLTAKIDAPTHRVAPKVTTSELAAKYPAYILIDRKAHQLRFYRHLELSQTYPIAVGRAGLETPSGIYDVQWKEVNPAWHVPNSSWAGKLAGTTVPPGPKNPIKARWMAFDGGAGIHGIDPSEYSSIGQDASHGCVRMRIPDVISLYGKSPVGTPVYVA